jgi:membrane protease YdiL (CAAX protease family)
MSDDVLAAPKPPHPLNRFCTMCGASWQPDWVTCGACSPIDKASDVAHRQSVTSIRSPILLYFALLLTTLIGIIVIRCDAMPSINAELAMEAVDTIIVVGWCASRGRGDVLPALGRISSPKWYLLAIVFAACSYSVATALLSGIHAIFDVPLLNYSTDFLNAGYGWSAVIISVCVQPAIVEEMAFRGVILGGLQHHLNSAEAVVVSALLFMTLHLSIVSFPHLFLLGALLGLLRVKTGSLYPGMLLHFLHNLACILAEKHGGIFGGH